MVKIDIRQSVNTGWVVYRRSGWAVAGMIWNGFFRLFMLAVYYFPAFLWLSVVPDRPQPFWLGLLFLLAFLLAINGTIGFFLIRKLAVVHLADDEANTLQVKAMLTRDFPNYRVKETERGLIEARWSSDFSPTGRQMLFILDGGSIGVNSNSTGRDDWKWMSLAILNYRRSRRIARQLAAEVA